MYPSFPSFHTWNNAKKVWIRRKRPKRSNAVGRVYAVPPNQGERYYLRRVLYHVPGAKNFKDLRTINGRLCETFKEVCKELGLLEDDSEWENCLSEASLIQSGSQLRRLLVTILLHCFPENPRSLFDKFHEALSEDHHHRLLRENPLLQNHLKEAKNCMLRDLEDQLCVYK